MPDPKLLTPVSILDNTSIPKMLEPRPIINDESLGSKVWNAATYSPLPKYEDAFQKYRNLASGVGSYIPDVNILGRNTRQLGTEVLDLPIEAAQFGYDSARSIASPLGLATLGTIKYASPYIKPIIKSLYNKFDRAVSEIPVNIAEKETPKLINKLTDNETKFFETVKIQLANKVPLTSGQETRFKKISDKLLEEPKEILPSSKTTNYDAAKQWATKLQAAKTHGDFAADDFKDLKGQSDLIGQFQEGHRTGRLQDVAKLMDDLYEQEQKLGIKSGKKENYLKQIWEDPDESVRAVPSSVAPKEASFQKKSTFKSYAQGKAAGFTPKYNDITDIIASRVASNKRAIANKEFYDYLKDTNQIKKGAVLNDSNTWELIGPYKNQLQRFTNNVLGTPWKPLQVTGQAVSRTKNISLAGGIPGTPLNIHGYNIAKSEFYARGLKGVKDFARGVLNPNKDLETLERTKPLVRKALDHGYQTFSENIPEDELTKLLDKNAVGKAFNWTTDKAERFFEDPLFKVRLPAAKALILEDNYNRLIKTGITEEQALKKASEIANIFMGGMNKALRNKNGQNLLQTIFLAPDWAESRIRFAGKQLLSVIGKEDPIYRKALIRSGALGAGGLAISKMLGNKGSDKPAATTNIAAGKTSSGKLREIPIYGTSNELLRIPANTITGLKQGDPTPFTDLIKNRLSIPMDKTLNIIKNSDDFGNPLFGKDKYGRKIPARRQAINLLKQLGAPLSYQAVQGLVDYMDKSSGVEESIVKALELPLTYRSPNSGGSKRKGSFSF